MSRNIPIPELMQQVGLDELATISTEEITSDFMPAAISGFAEGDLVTLHRPYTGREAELYGENHYGDGKVARTLGRAAIENGMTPGNLYDFQGFAAEYFMSPQSPFKSHKPTGAIRIYPEAVTIDGNALELARKPSVMIDYGACLTGRSYIADQMAFLQQGNRPFMYAPMTRTHFMNQSLINNYDATYGPGTAQAVHKGQLYIGREDGVAAATDEIIRAQTAHQAPTDIADIILCTGANHAEPEDVRQGIANSHTLLKEGGVLIVRSLARPGTDELGTKEIAGWAFDAGFSDKHVVRYEAAINQVGALLLGGHFGEREIETFVLTK